MQDHFPFFLAYFPQTVDILSRELTALLEDAERATFWEQAVTCERQRHDIAHGWDPQRETLYDVTVERLIQSIPQDSDLRFCFWFDDYLQDALEDAIAAEALELDGSLPGGRMLRCAHGNLITLTRTLDPMHFYHPKTTEDHRKQVDTYVKEIRALRQQSPRPPDMDEVSFRKMYWDAYQKVREEHPGTRVSKTKVADELLIVPKTLKRYCDRYNAPFPPLSPD